VAQNSVREGEVLVISMPGEEGSGTQFRLASSEKELPEQCSGAFRHKNTLVYNLRCITIDGCTMQTHKNVFLHLRDLN
jgi:hypothetical protein